MTGAADKINLKKRCIKKNQTHFTGRNIYDERCYGDRLSAILNNGIRANLIRPIIRHIFRQSMKKKLYPLIFVSFYVAYEIKYCKSTRWKQGRVGKILDQLRFGWRQRNVAKKMKFVNTKIIYRRVRNVHCSQKIGRMKRWNFRWIDSNNSVTADIL